MKNRILRDLLGTFARIGLFTFGGGYAMISLIEDQCVEKKKWITHEEMMDVTVIAESTPGPIAINCATFVGWKQAGLPGALTATLGIVLPSFLIIFCLSSFLDAFLAVPLVANAFRGIRVAVGVLILQVGWGMYRKMPRKLLPRALCWGAFFALTAASLFAWNLSTIVVMVTAGCISLALFCLQKGKGAAK